MFTIRLILGIMIFSLFSSSITLEASATGGNVGPDGSPGWTYCAEEGEWNACDFSGTKEVRYWGYDQSTIGYRTKVVTDSIVCTTAAFGGIDPADGVVKRCYYRDVQLDSGGITTAISGLNNIVTVTFSVYAKQAGTTDDLKSKIKVQKTIGGGFAPLGQADSVVNPTSTVTSSTIEIQFDEALTGSDNAIRIDGGAFVDSSGALYGQSLEIDPLRFSPPVLVPDAMDNDTESVIEITFGDDPLWRGAITTVSNGGFALTEGTQYSIGAGIITINVGVLAKGTHNLVVEATGYLEASVDQSVDKFYEEPESGTGTEDDPYLIATPEQLDGVRENMGNLVHYRLKNDIDLSGYPNWEPIGTYNDPFYGHFDGNGKVISGLTIARVGGIHIGLFGWIEWISSIKNVMLRDVNIIGGFYVGGLVGNGFGIIENCSVTGTVSGEHYVGGLVGGGYVMEIGNSFSSAGVSGISSIGGLAGSFNGTISHSYATGDVSGKDAGGLVGTNYGEILHSFATGIVTGINSSEVGGLVGFNDGGVIGYSYASGIASGSRDVGGLVGYNVSGEISNSYASAAVSGYIIVGGLIGFNDSGEISNSYASGAVNGLDEYSENLGGLIGEDDQGTIVNSFYDTVTTGQSVSAGGVGKEPEAMKDIATYEEDSTNAWDFEDLWAIDASLNGGYPYLREIQVFLSYDGNGSASGTVPASLSLTPGMEADVYSGTVDLLKAGRLFGGWNTQSDGEGAFYFSGDSISINENTLLYAKWNTASATATVSSAIGTVSSGGMANETITNVPYGTLLSAFKTAITPVAGATFEIYDADGTTVATTLATGKKAIVTAEDGISTVTYTVTVRGPLSQNATLTSTIGIVSADGTANETITNVPNGTLLSAFKAAITPAAGATFEIYDADGTTVAATLATGKKAIVTAEDGISTVTYTVTINAAAQSGSGGGGTTPSYNSTNGRLTLPAGQAGAVSLDGVIVNVPANASDKEIRLTIDKVEEGQKLVSDNYVLLSTVYELMKNFPENFANAVTITFTFDALKLKDNQTAVVYYYDETKKSWVEVKGGTVSGNRITVTVNHFTKFVVLAAQSVAPSTNVDPTVKLSDIAGHWAEASIKQAVAGAIVKGYSDGTFKPNNDVTRAEFAVMLMKALGTQSAEVKLSFTDTAKIGAWARTAVGQAVQAGYVKGYSDGTFRPNEVLTRAEMAMMVAQAAHLKIDANASSGFSDDKDIPKWAKGAIAVIKEHALMKGKSSGRFDPYAETTRAEAVTVLLKLITK